MQFSKYTYDKIYLQLSMNCMGGLELQRVYRNWYNGSRRNLLVVFNNGYTGYVVRKRERNEVQVCNDKTKRFESKI